MPPMLCKEAKVLPRPGDWFYEVKHDGYRAVGIKDGKKVLLLSRHGKPLDYPKAHDALRTLPVHSAVIDCELVALDDQGRSSVESLHRGDATVALYAFDLLFVNGRDITGEPIEKRKERLCSMALDSSLLFSPSLNCEPEMLMDQVKHLSLGGIIAKRKGSPYQPGQRSGAWLKMRVNQQAEFLIGGYAPGEPLESVVVGHYQQGKLLFCANVHAGLTPALRRKLIQQLERLRADSCPFTNLPDKRPDPWREGITAADMERYIWTEPTSRVIVAFREFTAWGRLRHPAFSKLLRDRRSPRTRRRTGDGAEPAP